MSRIVAWIQALALALGAPGLFLVSFLDSTFVPLPELNDLLLVAMATHHKPRMLLYALTATAGSLAGSFVLYAIGRKGGEPFVRRRFPSGRVDRALGTLRRNGFATMLTLCLLPPPAPFKLFVLLAGTVGISSGRFALAITLGRAARFLALGVLAVRYGDAAIALIEQNGEAVSLGLVAVIVVGVVSYVLWRSAIKRKAR